MLELSGGSRKDAREQRRKVRLMGCLMMWGFLATARRRNGLFYWTRLILQKRFIRQSTTTECYCLLNDAKEIVPAPQ